MALSEFDSCEDDFVFLSDFEEDQPTKRGLFSRPHSILHTHGSSKGKTRASGESSSSRNPLEQEPEDDSDLEDIEEIEYGYDNDTLLIMPAMLRDYSHHATNYHPELWRAPIPGSSSSLSSLPSSSRLRHEDRMLDRTELLKNAIPPTTCGICFDSFTTFDLNPAELLPKETSSKAHFALSFAARLARSFSHTGASDPIPTSPVSASTSPLTSPTEPQVVTASHSSSSVPTSSSVLPSSATITPSLSSKDLGIVMPCQHGLCLSCLQSFLTNAAQNPQARFPTLCPQPGCRTPVPTESAELVLDSTTLEAWYRKLAEIHVANKVCCPQPSCRSIIDLDDRNGTAVTCPECRSSFCASCAVPFHRGMSCEQYQTQARGGESEEDRAMLQLVRDRHWRHCPACRFVIEKQQGCNHMVCHCGQSFCYNCGQTWNELDARCSQDCESEGIHEDIALDCNIM